MKYFSRAIVLVLTFSMVITVGFLIPAIAQTNSHSTNKNKPKGMKSWDIRQVAVDIRKNPDYDLSKIPIVEEKILNSDFIKHYYSAFMATWPGDPNIHAKPIGRLSGALAVNATEAAKNNKWSRFKKALTLSIDVAMLPSKLKVPKYVFLGGTVKLKGSHLTFSKIRPAFTLSRQLNDLLKEITEQSDKKSKKKIKKLNDILDKYWKDSEKNRKKSYEVYIEYFKEHKNDKQAPIKFYSFSKRNELDKKEEVILFGGLKSLRDQLNESFRPLDNKSTDKNQE